ncbi:MAG: type II toxin-antitoxin system ParD family antitoxin [Candidatus Diapherotrites archaeon]|nr:type II toxin-antitoxin system ParD family antitoxin [Candidatus Diapherotrites archaeon]
MKESTKCIKNIAGYNYCVSTLSADVTSQMVNWIDAKVKSGMYKSRSEVIRDLLREKIGEEKYSRAALSESVLRKIWNNEKDSIWESYL